MKRKAFVRYEYVYMRITVMVDLREPLILHFDIMTKKN
jgi:hypothetical protein